MSLKLRDLIRQVRACKTAAEERAVIAKESAMIRTAIREEQAQYRHRNVAKLLFMHMLGYPTHFGQLECMKLIASPHFPEKRIGYLGMMLLLSEEADVLMLATNGLKNDLNSDNKFISGLSLCAIGNLATADMSRDLAPEVDKHLKSTQPYLRKKACLAMARCLTKCPEMVEDFVDRVVTLLKDRNHGVLITVVQLMTQVLIMDQKNMELEGCDEDEISPCQDAFLRLVPSLVKLLRNIISGGYSDAGSGPDPFLQVQILTLLRLLGTGNAKASEEMNDVLAQVATNTETSKNAGNAILYECVQTIMAIESEDTLRVLAVNILGRFLLNRDNNIRYVALNTLSNCIMEENQAAKEDLMKTEDEGENSAASALQRHRTTIVDCLKDPDISIRQRALELIYHLVNKNNVEDLTGELLNYLVLCPREHRADICTRVLRVVDKFSPNDRWRVDTLITMLTIAGRECARSIQSACIIYISRSSEDLRAYATHKLLKAIRDDDGSQRGLLVVAIWCIGEYGDLLLKPYTYNPTPGNDLVVNQDVVSISFMAIEPSSIVTTVEEVSGRHNCGEEVKVRALTCYTKLSDRFADSGDTETLERLHEHVKMYSKDYSLELQLRSCEFDALINAMKGISVNNASSENGDIFGISEGTGAVSSNIVSAAKEALARMPVVDISVMQKKRSSGYSTSKDEDILGSQSPEATSETPVGGDLLDLNDIFGGADTAQQTETAAPSANGDQPKEATQQQSGQVSDMDLLSDIFSAPPAAPTSSLNGNGNGVKEAVYDPFNMPPAGNGPAIPTTNHIDAFAPAPSPAVEPAVNDIFSLSTPAEEKKPTSTIVHGVSYEGLSIDFTCSKPDPMDTEKSTLVATFKNLTSAPINGFSLQCAVPKYVKMELLPPTSTTIPVTVGDSASVTQTIKVTNSMIGKKNLMLKLKIAFTSNGTKFNHMATCSGFPSGEF